MNDVVESFGKYIGDLTENNPVKARKRLLSFTVTNKQISCTVRNNRTFFVNICYFLCVVL